MSTSSSGKSVSGAVRRRAALIFSGALLALVACGAMASSALALSWWVEETPPTVEELAPGKKLLLGSAAKVNSAFTLKWKKKFEISCGGEVTYNNLYIEGHLGIGAEGGIDFGKCVAKKPKGTVLIGGKVETVPLAGSVEQSGSKYLFTLKPKTATVVAAFQLERTVKPRKHYKAAKNKLCTYNVEAIGKLEGELGDKPEKISSEKTLDFASHELTMKSTKECVTVMMAKPAAKKPLAKSALVLKTKGKGALPPGSPIEAFSSNLIEETSAGNLECEENRVLGTLTNNSGATDNATINAAISTGHAESIPGACKTSATGPALIQWSGLPWTAAISSKGQIKVGGQITVTAEFLALPPGENACTYLAPGLKATNNLEGPVTITLTKQPFKLKSGTTSLCPTAAVTSGTFSLSSEGEPVEAELGVSEKEHEEEKEEVAEEEAEEAEEEAGLPLEGNKGKLGYSGNSGWGLL